MKKIKITMNPSQIKTRVTWEFNPATRVVPDKKNYSRKNFDKKILLKQEHER